MNWLKELLEKAVITDGELDVDALMEAVNTEFPKHAVPKSTYNELSNAKKQLDLDIAGRDKQLKELGDMEGITEKQKEKIGILQNENKEAKEAYEAKVKELTMSNAIKLALSGKVHDEDLAAGLIDKEKLVIGDDGKVVGLDEQLTGLKESKAFLFVPEDGGTPEIKGAKPAEGDNLAGKKDEGGSFGERLAKESSESNKGLEEARQSYFG